MIKVKVKLSEEIWRNLLKIIDVLKNKETNLCRHSKNDTTI